MTAALYVMETANLYCGDDDPANSKHLTLEGWTLPDLEHVFSDHHPGGSMVGIEVAVGVKKIVSPLARLPLTNSSAATAWAITTASTA